jgi:hypothetical protein
MTMMGWSFSFRTLMTTTMMTTLVVFLRLVAFLCREVLHSQLGGGCDDFHNVPFVDLFSLKTYLQLLQSVVEFFFSFQ